MNEKRPIDKKRESGGSIDVGTDKDGAILEMCTIGKRLIVIKEKSLYELMMADSVDPDRTNIGLPNMIQKLIINEGSESKIVGKTLLTAKTLFRPEFFDRTFDTQMILSLSLDLLIEGAILKNEINQYLENEQNQIKEYEDRREKALPYKLPTIIDLEPHCKTIFQKADHIEQIIMEIILLFYPDKGLTKQSHFPLFLDLLKKLYGDTDPFTKFIESTIYFMRVIREVRNALDHRLKYCKVFNFDLQPDSSVISPSIELHYKAVVMERVALSTFLPIVLENLINLIEDTFAYLAIKKVRPNAMISKLMEIPEGQRRNKFVKYGFWSNIGEGGYFYQ